IGDTVRITLISDGNLHSLVIPDFKVNTGQFSEKDKAVTAEFTAITPGEFEYYCDVPGHRAIGMVGKLRITGEVKAGDRAALDASKSQAAAAVATMPPVQPADPKAVAIVRNPADVSPPVGKRDPKTVRIDLTSDEMSG